MEARGKKTHIKALVCAPKILFALIYCYKTHISSQISMCYQACTSLCFKTHMCACMSEFLNVTVSQSCDRANFSWLGAKSWGLYVQAKYLCILTSFTVFSSWFTHIKWSLVWILFFSLRKSCLTKVWTAQKKLILECLLYVLPNLYVRLSLPSYMLQNLCVHHYC